MRNRRNWNVGICKYTLITQCRDKQAITTELKEWEEKNGEETDVIPNMVAKDGP